jgi:hypothetical protein
MPLVDNEGYDKLQKNNIPAKLMVMVMVIATVMAISSATAIAFNGNGVFPENCPYFIQAHKKDVPFFPVWCRNRHKKIPNVMHALNPKGHAKAAFWADWNAYSPSLPTCTKHQKT